MNEHTVTFSAAEFDILKYALGGYIAKMHERIRRAERIAEKYEGGAIPPPRL